jgi:hypothetical protein
VIRTNAGPGPARWTALPVVRVALRLGPATFQAMALVYLAGCAAFSILDRPDLLRPAAIGTDASNYYAAGLRLNAGHPLYELSPGDREVPVRSSLDVAPLLSPPPVAVLWRPLALLPGDLVMTLWAAAGGLLLVISAAWLVTRLRTESALAMLVVGPMVGLTIWSGNVHAYLVAALVLAWLAHERGHPAAAGAIAGVAAALKISPILLLPWFVARRDWRGAGAMVAALAAVGILSLAGAGLDNHLAYVGVAGTASAAGATPLSVPGILASLGLPGQMVHLAPVAVMTAGALAMWPLRSRPGIAWAVALVAGIYGTPVVHMVGLSALLAALAPFRGPSLLDSVRTAGEPAPP